MMTNEDLKNESENPYVRVKHPSILDATMLDSPQDTDSDTATEKNAAGIELPDVAPHGLIEPRITVFEHERLGGDRWTTTGGYSFVGSDWNDKISSFIVHSGVFEFYGARDYGAQEYKSKLFEAGIYGWVGDFGIPNDTISSWKAYYSTPNQPAPSPAPVPPRPTPPPPPEKPLDFIRLESHVIVLGSACQSRGHDRFSNSHRTRAILVNYEVLDIQGRPQPRSITVLPNTGVLVGCTPDGGTRIKSGQFL